MDKVTDNAPGAAAAAQSAEPTAQEREKTFTQTEVDALIAQRLARERKKYPGPEELAAFHSWQQTGRVRFTARLGPDGEGAVTREQIMAIPDRAARRRAIANNLDLF